MAKLFKTISLEERYKESLSNQLPAKPKAVNQGNTQLQPTKPSKELESALLKTLPNAVEQNSNILKGMVKGPESIPPFINTKFRSAISLADRLSQPKIGSTTHLAQYFLSDVHTDHIKITPFGIFNHTSTTTIQPVKISIAQGGKNPTIYNPIASQGLIYANGAASSYINISVPTYNSLLLQGVFYSNGVYNSLTTITAPLQITNQGQGTNPTLSTSPSFLAPLQGPGVKPVSVISNASILFIQGTTTTNNVIESVIKIALPKTFAKIVQSGVITLGVPKDITQLEDYTTDWFDSSRGILVSQTGLRRPRTLLDNLAKQDANTKIINPKASLKQDDNITVNTPKSINQLEDYSTKWFNSSTGQMVSQTDLGTPKGGVEFVQTRRVVALSKTQQSPVLKTLRYASDRALAFFSPIIKHGDSNLSVEATTKGYFNKAGVYGAFTGNTFNGTNTDTTNRSEQAFANLAVMWSPSPDEPVDSQGLEDYLGSINLVGDPGNKEIPEEQLVKYDANKLGEKTEDAKGFPFKNENGKYLGPPRTPSENPTLIVTGVPAISLNHYYNEEKIKEGETSTISTSDFATLSYDQIKDKANNKNASITQPGSDFRLSIDKDKRKVKYINNKQVDTYIKSKGTVEDRSPITNGPIKSDFVTLKFIRASNAIDNTDAAESLAGNITRGNASVAFRSYVTNFSDSLTMGLDSKKYLNSATALLQSQEVSRAGSISFKVPFLSKDNTQRIKDKISVLAQIAMVKQANFTPIILFTFGNYHRNLPIVITSIKYDIQMAEYAWDIDAQLPQIIDVSVDYTVAIGNNAARIKPFSLAG